jgi:hypothetical protein
MDTTWFPLHGTETEDMMSHGCHVRVRGCRIGEINHFVKWEVSYLEEGNSTICPATCIYQLKNGNMKELIEQGQSKQQEASKCSSMQ